jgi:hypothetical protein
MARNGLLAEIAAGARLLGWERPAGIDHVEYVRRAVCGMWALHFALRASARPPWLAHAYFQEANDLLPANKLDRSRDLADLYGDLWALALVAPSRWAMEVALLALDRRRTGRAQSLVRACSRIQMAMERHGVDPIGRAGEHATRLRDDGRTRGLFLLPRETEILRESDDLWIWGGGVSLAPARPSSGGGDAYAGGEDGSGLEEDLEGWEEEDGDE